MIIPIYGIGGVSPEAVAGEVVGYTRWLQGLLREVGNRPPRECAQVVMHTMPRSGVNDDGTINELGTAVINEVIKQQQAELVKYQKSPRSVGFKTATQLIRFAEWVLRCAAQAQPRTTHELKLVDEAIVALARDFAEGRIPNTCEELVARLNAASPGMADSDGKLSADGRAMLLTAPDVLRKLPGITDRQRQRLDFITAVTDCAMRATPGGSTPLVGGQTNGGQTNGETPWGTYALYAFGALAIGGLFYKYAKDNKSPRMKSYKFSENVGV